VRSLSIDKSNIGSGISNKIERTTRRLAYVSYGHSGDVRFGSKADICSAQAHVRFAPDSDRESGHPAKVMSALPPRADMCGALANVR